MTIISSGKAASPADGVAPTRSGRWGAAAALVMLGLAAGYALMAIYLFNALQESAKAEMHLSDFDLSLIQGMAIAVPLSLFSAPFGVLADRTNRMRLLIVLIATLSISTAATALASSLPWMFAARVVASTAAAAVLTIVVSLGADFSAPGFRGRAMLVVNLGKIAGPAAAFAVGAALMVHFTRSAIPAWFATTEPWRATHIAVALGGAALALFLSPIREPARHEAIGAASFRRTIDEIWQRRAYLGPLLVGQVGIIMADAAATIWATPILARDYAVPPAESAGWLALILLGTGVAGSMIGGYAADLGRKSRIRGGVLLAAVVASAVSIPAALFCVAPDVPLFAVGLTVLLLGGTTASLALLAVVASDLPNETRGFTFGAFLGLGGLIGFGVTPTIVTLVSAAMGGEANLAKALAVTGTAVSVVVFVSFILAMRASPTPSDARLDP